MAYTKDQLQEIERIKAEYVARDMNSDSSNWNNQKYHPRNSLGRLLNQHHLNELIEAMNTIDLELSSKNILDLGCGNGYWLRNLVELGADPKKLTGIDISKQRIQSARLKNNDINYQLTNGIDIPFPDNTFQVVMQIVTLSSIVEESTWRHLISEMKRVNSKDGYILWFDHKKAFSDKLVGFTEKEVLNLFDEHDLVYKSNADPYFIRRYHRKYPKWVAALMSIYKGKTESVFLVLKRKNRSK